MKIITNNKPRELLHGWDLTEAERKELDYIAPYDDENAWCNETNRFFRYRGEVYDTNQFIRIVPMSEGAGFCHGVEDDSPLLKWDGIQTDSYFSGVVVRYAEDFESIVVGVATW